MAFWPFSPRGKRNRKVADDGSQPTNHSVATKDNNSGQNRAAKENVKDKSKGVALHPSSVTSPAPAPAAHTPDPTIVASPLSPLPPEETPVQPLTSTVQTLSLTEQLPAQAPQEPDSRILSPQSTSNNMNFHLPRPRGLISDRQKPPIQQHHPAATPWRLGHDARSPLSNITPNPTPTPPDLAPPPPPPPPTSSSTTTNSHAGSEKKRKFRRQKPQNDNDRRQNKTPSSQSSMLASAKPMRSASWSYSPTASWDRSHKHNYSSSKFDHNFRHDDRFSGGFRPYKYTAAEYGSEIDMEAYTFKINALDALTPRPLVRCSGVQGPDGSGDHVHYGHGARRISYSRDRGLVIPPVKEEEKRMRMRELADNLDAGALRELLERDQRRRELKRLNELEKKERRMQKRAANERRREEEAYQNDNQPGPSCQKLPQRMPETIRSQCESPDTHDNDNSNKSGQRVSWMTNTSADGTATTPSVAAARMSSCRGNIKFADQQAPQRKSLKDAGPSSNVPHQRASDPPPALRTSSVGSVCPSEPASITSPRSPAFGSRIASFFRRGSRIRRKNCQGEPNQQRESQPLSEFPTHKRQPSSSLVPPTAAPRGFSVPSRESFKNNPPQQVLSPPQSLDRSYMTPSPSIKRMHSKFIELMDYPIPNESVISRLSSSDAVSQNGAGPSGSFASVTEIRSGRRFEGEESSSSLNHYITDRSAVASPEPISEEHEPTTTHDMHSEQQRHISADEDSGIIVPSNDSVALARSLASIDSEGSWFSSRVSRSLSAKTARTQAQIGRYKATSPRDGDPPKVSIDSDVSDVDEDPKFDAHHEDDEEPDTAKSSHSMLGEISIREGANKGGRVVVHPSTYLMAHASKAEIASTENIDEENDSDWENRPDLELCTPNTDFGNKAEEYAVKDN